METNLEINISDTFTRTGYCENCKKNGNPKNNTEVLLFGSDRKVFFTKTTQHAKRKNIGFTPHIFFIEDIRDGKVFYKKTCGICGVQIKNSPSNKKKRTVNILKVEHEVCDIEKFQNIICYKDSLFTI